jgi:hypothetical protein
MSTFDRVCVCVCVCGFDKVAMYCFAHTYIHTYILTYIHIRAHTGARKQQKLIIFRPLME